MPLHDKAVAQEGIQFLRRKEQIGEKPLLGQAQPDDRSILQRVEVERVAREGQDRKLTGLRVELLAVTVYHDNAGAGRRIDKGGRLGEDRDRALRVAAVVDQETGDIAIGLAAADIESQLVRDRGEGAFLDQARDKAIADFKLQIPERPVGHRQEVGRQAHQKDKGYPRQDQHRLGQRQSGSTPPHA